MTGVQTCALPISSPPPACGLECGPPAVIKLIGPSAAVTAGTPFTVSYSITNSGGLPLNGSVDFTFQGQSVFDPQHPSGLSLSLAPRATISGKIQVNYATAPGGDLSAMAHTPLTPCGQIANLHAPRLCLTPLGSAAIPIAIGPLDILDTLSTNPPYDTSDPTWAKKICGGKTFMTGSSPKFEWTPVLDPTQAAESRVVAISGVLLAFNPSTADLWFTHPFAALTSPSPPPPTVPSAANFQGDWDMDVGWSSNPNYDYLLAPPQVANDPDTLARNGEAAAAGLTNPRAMHVEAAGQFIPHAYQANVNDRVVIFGRWIVDCGHSVFQTEIHPPLLFAAARPQGTSTVSTVIGRPFLVDQTFDGDGLYDYAIKQIGEEAAKSLAPPFPGALILGDQLHASTAIETKPFTGLQWMIYYVRPPVPAQKGQVPEVTYHFKVHSGVVVQVFDTRDGHGTIGVSVLFNDILFNPNTLPKPVEWTVPLDSIKSYDDLDAKLDAALFGSVAIGNAPMAGLIGKGVRTVWYALPAIVEAPDVTVLSSALTANTTTVVDDTQPYPIAGGVTVRWVTVPHIVPIVPIVPH